MDGKTTVKVSTPEEKALDTAILSVIQTDTLNTVPKEPSSTSSDKVAAIDLKDKAQPKTEVNIKPEAKKEIQLAKKDLIASSLIRFPLIPRRKIEVSTYTPTLFNYYDVIHHMDSLITNNIYYERTGFPWHPIISRLYFGVLAYYQTLRAMDYAKIGTSQTRTLTAQLIRDLPPERLPVPGPLMPILKSICCTEPEDNFFRLVSPKIPDLPGPNTNDTLLCRDPCMLGMPNIPALLGIANSYIAADGEDFPDYTNPEAFNNTANHQLSGHTFNAGAWTLADRSILSQPGMHKVLETDYDIDEQFSTYGNTLQLPVMTIRTPRQTIEEFTQLSEITWIDNILNTMSYYSTFFKDSGNLGQCTPFGPTACLVRSRPTSLTSTTAPQNQIFTLDHAFPDTYPYRPIYNQRSYEMSLTQIYSLMGQYSCINTRCDYRGMNIWAQINSQDSGRQGPYWDQYPDNLNCTEDKGFLQIDQIIAREYFIESPELKN